jgi:hypothetical protein
MRWSKVLIKNQCKLIWIVVNGAEINSDSCTSNQYLLHDARYTDAILGKQIGKEIIRSNQAYTFMYVNIEATLLKLNYLFLIGRVHVFYVGHVDKSCLYETIFQCNILSKYHHHHSCMSI